MRKAANIVLRRICFGSLNMRFTGLLRISDFVLRTPYGEFRICRQEQHAGPREVIPMGR